MIPFIPETNTAVNVFFTSGSFKHLQTTAKNID